MNWEETIAEISPHVLRIETPNGYGTGFLTFYTHDLTWCGIATAAHVVSHADEWQQPIKLRNASTTTPKFLKAEDRVQCGHSAPSGHKMLSRKACAASSSRKYGRFRMLMWEFSPKTPVIYTLTGVKRQIFCF